MIQRQRQKVGMPEFGRRISIVLTGNKGCGKTALALQSVNQSPKESAPTVGVDTFLRGFQNHRKQEVRINIWDTSGNDAFDLTRKEFYKESHAVLLCFDVGNRESFESLDKWMREAMKFGDTKMMVVALKTDTVRMISEQQAKGWASSKGLQYIEVSAFNNSNVAELWSRVIEI